MDKIPLQVLFIEDSRADVELTVAELHREDFEVSWNRVDTEGDLRHALAETKPEVVISDYTIPGFDGFKALQIVREMRHDLPFIFLSGTIGEEHAIESIHFGATDYVLKSNMRRVPFSVRRALSEADERARTRAAEESRARLAAILEATSDCVAICNPDGDLIYLNSAGQAMTGLRVDDLAETNISSLHPTESWEAITNYGWPTAMDAGLWQAETAMIAADGSEIPMSQVIIAHRAQDGAIEYFSTIARDIRDRKAYEERIAYLANYDALTGLPNRSLLGDRVEQAIAYRRSSERSLSLLTIDIDRFKLLNDGYGQVAGDEILRMVGERLCETVREGDTVARLDADSFAVLAIGLAHPDDTLIVARKIQSAIREPFTLNGREFHLTVSIGASVFPRDGAAFEHLIWNAAAAMNRVKTSGQDSFQFYDANMSRDAAIRVDLENELRVAAGRGQLELHYQPQVVLASGHIVGVEALMRWKHPEHGWISPGEFIPIAEHSDCIHGLGEWALSRACRQLQEWKDEASHLRMAVNVSAHQFRDKRFTKVVESAIRESGVDPNRLVLELTESALVEDQEGTAATLEELKRVGVRIAVDDFGTGYSSLNYLSRLPIDCLKIDRAFLQRIPGERNDVAIVQAIISLAHALGLNVVAEGVETEEQLKFLEEHGCVEGQGFLFAKPMVPAEIDLSSPLSRS